MIVGIKHIKFMATENIINKKIKDIRKKERYLIKLKLFLGGIGSILSEIPVPLACFLCIGAYLLMEGEVNLTTVYAFSMYVGMIRINILGLTNTITTLLTMLISFKRVTIVVNQIEDYEEKVSDSDSGLLAEAGDCSVVIKNGFFSWEHRRYKEVIESLAESNQSKKNHLNNLVEMAEELMSGDEMSDLILKDISLKIQKGELCYIVGKVGSGKSSLLCSILNLMNKVEGEVQKKGSIAYIPQEAFLLNDTLKNNILFGKEFDRQRYEHTLKICQLVPDLKILPGGDQTEIGERGINLSGGQKQRIAIARAVYSDSDLYLIDDCLSALDAGVGKAVLNEVILGELSGKTRLVVTHFCHFFEDSDRVVLMKKGVIEGDDEFGKIKLTPRFKEYAVEVEEKKRKESESEEESQNPKNSSNRLQKEIDAEGASKRELRQSEKAKLLERNDEGAKEASGEEVEFKLTKKEDRGVGMAGFDVYSFYFKSGGRLILTLALVTAAASGLFYTLMNWYLGNIGKKDQKPLSPYEIRKNQITNPLPHPSHSPSIQTKMWIYFSLAVIFTTATTLLFHQIVILTSNASFTISCKLTWNILRRPMRFFDTTPSGVIQNRCTSDIEGLDSGISGCFSGMFYFLAIMTSSICLTIIITPLIVFAILPIFLLVSVIIKRYLQTASELKRLCRISTSPLLTTTSEIMNGISLIRHFGFLGIIMNKWQRLHDYNLKVRIHDLLGRLWCQIRLQSA